MSTPAPDPILRLIDLAVEWPLQYAGESTVFGLGAYPGVADRLGQVDGYLSAAAAAIVWTGPGPGDRPDPWAEAGSLMARIEAEFPGRLLDGPDDLRRFDDEPPGGLTWAVAGLRDLPRLLRSPEDLEPLGRLIDRGIRAVRLAGMVDRAPDAPEDDRGLDDASRAGLGLLASSGRSGLLVDLAGLAPRAAGDAIEICTSAGGALVPIVSLAGPADGTIAGLRPDDFDRLRSLGGLVGLGVGRGFHPDAEALARSVASIAGRSGIESVAIGTGYLGIDSAADGLGTAPDLLGWLASRFDREAASRIASRNASALIGQILGGDRPGP